VFHYFRPVSLRVAINFNNTSHSFLEFHL
jgi:hypothetical protein